MSESLKNYFEEGYLIATLYDRDQSCFSKQTWRRKYFP